MKTDITTAKTVERIKATNESLVAHLLTEAAIAIKRCGGELPDAETKAKVREAFSLCESFASWEVMMAVFDFHGHLEPIFTNAGLFPPCYDRDFIEHCEGNIQWTEKEREAIRLEGGAA